MQFNNISNVTLKGKTNKSPTKYLILKTLRQKNKVTNMIQYYIMNLRKTSQTFRKNEDNDDQNGNKVRSLFIVNQIMNVMTLIR